MADLLMKQVLAVIDSRTTVICLHAAGQIRKVDEPFETLIGEQDTTPFHVHCRSMEMPWMPGFVNGLRKDANAELMRRPLKQRRIGPGGEIGGSLPPKVGPSGTPPLPDVADLDPARWAGKDMPRQKFEETFRGNTPTFTDDDYFDWLGYQSAGSAWNMELRGLTPPGVWGDSIQKFDDVWERRSLALEQETVVYRAVMANPKYDPSTWEPGQYVVDAGWSSTAAEVSQVESIARQGWMLKILCPSGTRYVHGLEQMTEVVLQRNARFKIGVIDKEARVAHLILETDE